MGRVSCVGSARRDGVPVLPEDPLNGGDQQGLGLRADPAGGDLGVEGAEVLADQGFREAAAFEAGEQAADGGAGRGLGPVVADAVGVAEVALAGGGSAGSP